VLPFSRTTADKDMELADEWKVRTGQSATAGCTLTPALLAGGSRAVLELTDDQYTEIAISLVWNPKTQRMHRRFNCPENRRVRLRRRQGRWGFRNGRSGT
jgi:hypothetical protein